MTLREAAQRLVDHADFQLGGILSADSKARDIPSKAVSQVKARHLAALRQALAQPESKPSDRADLIVKLRADFNEDRVDFDNIKAAADMLEADAQQVAVPPTPASENPHQDYLARYWQLGYDGGDLEACSGDAPLIAYREGKSTRAQQVAVPQQPNNDEVICPSCCTQFRAIPVNVQRLILDAGFEPPFVAVPQPAYVPLSDAARQELVTNWFADGWAVKAAYGLLDDYDSAINKRGKT